MIYSAHPQPRSVADKLLPLRVQKPLQLDRVEASTSESAAGQFDLDLAERIITRIESRVPGRIRHLSVDTTENAIVLTGECSTFYTKQVAQHAAMGVMEYERLINNIDVRVEK